MTSSRWSLPLMLAAVAWGLDWLHQQLVPGVAITVLAFCLDAELTGCLVAIYGGSGAIIAGIAAGPAWTALALFGRLAANARTPARLRRGVAVLSLGFVLGAFVAGITCRMVPSTSSVLFWPWNHLAAIGADLALACWALITPNDEAS